MIDNISSVNFKLRLKRYLKTKYPDNELIFLNRLNWNVLEQSAISFSDALLYRLRKSILGQHLEEVNFQQSADRDFNEVKLDMIKFKMKNWKEQMPNYLLKNNLFDDTLSFLEEKVKSSGYINIRLLEETLKHLRLINSNIMYLEEGLRKFKFLQILILSGNWITEIKGSVLPRGLKYLDVYANYIRSLNLFYDDPPKCMLHLNFGRNCLRNESELQLLACSKNFKELRVLDLSDNDIYDLQATVKNLKNLKRLQVLYLEGNPCSVVQLYKDIVLYCFPHLKYLDGIELTKTDKDINLKWGNELGTSQLEINFYRIINLPRPLKEKKVLHRYYVQVCLPLLEPEYLEFDSEEEESNIKTDNQMIKKESLISDKPKSKNSSFKESVKENAKGKKKNVKSKSSKKSNNKEKNKTIYDLRDEYNYERDELQRDLIIKSEYFTHKKLIELAPIYVKPPENDLFLIRDTLRSRITIKIIYEKVKLPPKKKPKAKSKKKKQKTKEEISTISEPVDVPKDATKPALEILKKITLTTIQCDLHSINWSEKTIDYYWAQHPKANPIAIEVEGSLQGVNYGKSSDKKKKTVNLSSELSSSGVKKSKLPKIFTCQLGFGLSRSYFS